MMTWNGINETMQQLPWFCITRTFVLREEKRERERESGIMVKLNADYFIQKLCKKVFIMFNVYYAVSQNSPVFPRE